MVLPVKVDAKVEAKLGERSVDKLIDAVGDVFAPATELMGLLGDAVRLARVELAATITRRAKVIADEQGLELVAPPLKFLVPFYEKASTEDGADRTLVEMWSRLLVSASSSYSARQLRYTSILSEMSPTQARILSRIANNYGSVLGRDVDETEFFYDMVESRLVDDLKKITEEDKDKIFNQIMQNLWCGGISIVIVVVAGRGGDDYYADWTGDEVYKDELNVEFEILKSMGLIDRIATNFFEIPHADISVVLFHMTELGLDFWRACGGLQAADVPASGA